MGLLSRVETRASIENPSTSLSDPADWLVEVLGGGTSAAGVNVSEKSALKSAPVWAAVNVLSQDVSKLPLITFERLERGKRRASEHPHYRLLKERPNPQMSSSTFRKTLQAHVATWGNAYAEIERNGAGGVINLWPLLPNRTSAQRINGEKVIITHVDGRDIPLVDENVLHVPGLGFDGIRGYSVIAHARDQIGAEVASQKFGSQFFAEGARPGGVITRPDSLTEDARKRLRDSWNRRHQGLTRAQRVAVLDEGMDYKQIGVPPEDAQFIGSREFSVLEIARFFRMPPHKIQMLVSPRRSNIESESISYVTDTLMYWLVTWEQEIARKLFGDDQFFAEFVVQGIMRGNSQARAEFYERGIRNGWMTPNEARERENMNPKEGGDKLFLPLDLFPLGEAPPAVDGDGGEDEVEADMADRMAKAREVRSLSERRRLRESNLRGFEAAANRVIDSETTRLRKIADKQLSRDSGEFLADVDQFYRGFGDVVQREFTPLITSYADAIKSAVSDELARTREPDPQFDRFVSDYTDGMALRHVRKSQQQIEAIVRDLPVEEHAEAVRERLEEWEETRAGKIASVETTRAMGALSKAAYVGAGIISLVWRAVGENCPFCRKMNGKVVSTQDNFARKGDFIDPDDEDAEPMMVRQSIGHPPIHQGCDCLVSPGSI